MTHIKAAKRHEAMAAAFAKIEKPKLAAFHLRIADQHRKAQKIKRECKQ